MSSCSDIPCFGIIVNRFSNALVKPTFRQLRHLLFYKGLVNDLESEIKKLKIQKEVVDRKAVTESFRGKIINKDVQVWRQDAEKIINDLENFLRRYQEKGSKMGFKDLPFPYPVSLNRSENIPISCHSYLISYKAIVNYLNRQTERVKNLDDEVARRIHAEQANGKIIEVNVMEWHEQVVEIKTSADELLGQIPSCTCFKVLQFPNPVSRSRLGREAARLAKNAVELAFSGECLLANEIAYLPPDEDEDMPLSDTPYQVFGSREEAYWKLWEALVKEDGDPIIGIYGMAGVGKTRMVEQVWKEAKEKGIFHNVTRVNVGAENIDVIKLQNQLAGYLGCHFESVDNVVLRASQLKNSLINLGKTLVIFDDVWDFIPLNRIGILIDYHSSNGSKILLTSRRQDVCLRNNCQDTIKINILTDVEGWEMFNNTVGISKIESLNDTVVAEKLCKKCGGLPLLIHAIGHALKDASEYLWKDALYQLENAHFEQTAGIETSVYRTIRLSVDYLADATKACLLLCALFEEDEDIDIKMLSDLAKGSRLLDNGRNIYGLIDMLKACSLLIEGEDDRTVKMHDIIRDVARSIAETDPNYAFLYKSCSSWSANGSDYRNIKLLQLDLEGDNILFPDNLVWPDLQTLWLQCNSHAQQHLSGFFKGVINLRVLVIKGLRFFQHQLSIHGLDKLRVLILDRCHVIPQTFLNSVSRNLETLCIRECLLPSPLDLPYLRNLRKLELISGSEIVMLPNVISRASNVEELNIPGGIKISEEAATSISAELSKLTLLRTLIFHFDDSLSCPDGDIIHNLVEFNLHVGSKSYSSSPRNTPARWCSRSITIQKSNINGYTPAFSTLMALVEGAEEVNLLGLECLPNGFSYSDGEAFQNLKKLYIERCNDMGHLARLSGQHDMQRLTFFCKLSMAEISGCRGLKFLFSVTVAKCLVEMKELRIDDCPMMEEILMADGPTDGEIITFPKLKVLMLKDLPIITSFYNDKPSTNSSSVEITEISSSSTSFFSEKVEFPALEKLVINNIGNKGELWATEVLKQKYDKITTSGTEAEGDNV